MSSGLILPRRSLILSAPAVVHPASVATMDLATAVADFRARNGKCTICELIRRFGREVLALFEINDLSGFGAGGGASCTCTPSGYAQVTGATFSAFGGFSILGTGGAAAFFDGVISAGAWFANGQTAGGIQIDFTAGTRYVDGVKTYADNSTSQGNWVLKGSTDAWSSSTIIGSSSWSFKNGNATNSIPLTPATHDGFSSIRIEKLNDGTTTSSTPHVYEIELSYCTC